MSKYLVKVWLEYETDIEVEANDVYEANQIAEQEVAEMYTVLSSTDEYLDFTSITAYDPEEIA